MAMVSEWKQVKAYHASLRPVEWPCVDHPDHWRGQPRSLFFAPPNSAFLAGSPDFGWAKLCQAWFTTPQGAVGTMVCRVMCLNGGLSVGAPCITAQKREPLAPFMVGARGFELTRFRRPRSRSDAASSGASSIPLGGWPFSVSGAGPPKRGFERTRFHRVPVSFRRHI